jgi:hypothetical protein
MDTENKPNSIFDIGFDSDYRVLAKLSIEIVGKRPNGVSLDEHMTAIVCAVMNGVVSQTALFLDDSPEICGVDDQLLRRKLIQDGFVIALIEHLCRTWTGKKEDLPGFVKMMQDLFEETFGAEGRGQDFPYPNVGDIGHA